MYLNECYPSVLWVCGANKEGGGGWRHLYELFAVSKQLRRGHAPGEPVKLVSDCSSYSIISNRKKGALAAVTCRERNITIRLPPYIRGGCPATNSVFGLGRQREMAYFSVIRLKQLNLLLDDDILLLYYMM